MDGMSNQVKYPIGVQTFEKVREKGYLYVGVVECTTSNGGIDMAIKINV